MGQLQDSLNTIWGVAPKPDRGLLGMLQDRFVSLGMVLGVGFFTFGVPSGEYCALRCYPLHEWCAARG